MKHPEVPSREERCPAAGEGTAAAGNEVHGRKEPCPREEGDVDRGEARRGAVEANREPQLEERPGRVPKRATHGPMKARVTFETAEAREEARRGPEARHPRAEAGACDVRNRRPGGE